MRRTPIRLLFFWTSLSPFGGFFGAVVGGFIWRWRCDFLREADATYGGLTPGHYSALLTLALGLFMLWRIKNRPVTVPRGMLSEPAEEAPRRSDRPPAKAVTPRRRN